MASNGQWNNDRLLTSLFVNGMKQNPPIVPYPQLTFCPLWKEGIITNVICTPDTHQPHDSPANHALLPTKLNSTWTSAKYPNNYCEAFNFDGTQIKSWNTTIMCRINSTNIDGNTTWPGRVRVFVDTPGTTNFDGCPSCMNGVDGTVAVAAYFTAGFWQASQVDTDDDDDVDYHCNTQRFPFTDRFTNRPIFDDMHFLGGFYSPNVWKFQHPGDFQAAIAGDQFGQFTAMVGGLGLISYAIWACLSTTLILIVVGPDGIPNKETPRTPLL